MKTVHVVARAVHFRPTSYPLGKQSPGCVGDCFVTKNKSVSRNDVIFFLLSSFLLFACAPATQTASQTETVSVYATSAAEPWMSELFACANDRAVVLRVDAESPDIYLRLGEPENLVSPAYQIDEEEILIVTHRESPVQNLSLEEAQALFAGQGDASAQVWVYASEADLQVLFDQLVMNGRSVTSFAKVAVNPQEMSDILNSESAAVGILPRHWKAGNVREVYSVGVVPVLAITKEEPQGVVSELIGCLQKD